MEHVAVNDALTRFVMDFAPVRGGIVRLNEVFGTAINDHDYPAPVARALGELLAATALLGSSLKWEGALVLQMQGDGPLTLLCADSDHQLNVRAVASAEGAIAPDAELGDMMPEGRVVITLDPKATNKTADTTAQMYQGIVALNPVGVAATVEDYMLQSQQVRTCIVLAAAVKKDQICAAGIFVQKLPGDEAANVEGYERIVALTRTLTADELLTLDAQTILTRLFHEEIVRVLPGQPVRFFCPCSEERVLNALRIMGREEVDSILEEHGVIDARCQFCNHAYRFGAPEMAALFAKVSDVPGSATKH
jgi:molecular chaperone Hsp33